jgi:hypothetical protein
MLARIANLSLEFCRRDPRKQRTNFRILFTYQAPRLISTKNDYTLFYYPPFDGIVKAGLFC